MAYEQAPLPSPRFLETYTNISGFHDPALPAFSKAFSSQVAYSIFYSISSFCFCFCFLILFVVTICTLHDEFTHLAPAES